MIYDAETHFVAMPRVVATERGIKYYFKIEPCKRGHVSERLTQNATCSQCAFMLLKKRRNDNLEDFLEKEREYRENNKERLNENMREWHKNNKEHELEYRIQNRERKSETGKRWKEENQDHVKAYNKRWREENRDRKNERNREYKKENPDRVNAETATRRAVRLQRTLTDHQELTDFVFEEASELCRIRAGMYGFGFHVDHIIPMQCSAASGLHVYYSLQVIPAWHNVSKGNRLIYTEPLEWLR